MLHPSWIEIPVHDLTRALTFYRAVFALTDTPITDEYPPARIAVLLASDKNIRAPGVSLVHSPAHPPGSSGAQVNFHLGDHATLEAAIRQAVAHGGQMQAEVVDLGDGTRYGTLLDSEGNLIALSSYEDPPDGKE